MPPVFGFSLSPPPPHESSFYFIAICFTVHTSRQVLREHCCAHSAKMEAISHKSMNLIPSSHICSTRALIATHLQFLYVVPLPLITGKIPERIICSNLVFFSYPTNCLYLCDILVVPSLAMPQYVLYPFSHMLYPRPPEDKQQHLLLHLMSCLSFIKWSRP